MASAGRMRGSGIFALFQQPTGDHGYAAICRRCGKRVKAQPGVTSNLVTHIRRDVISSLKCNRPVGVTQLNHPELYEEYQRGRLCRGRAVVTSGASHSGDTARVGHALVALLSDVMLPAHLISESRGLRLLLESAGYRGPVPDALTSFPEVRRKVIAVLASVLGRQQEVCLTIDLWPFNKNNALIVMGAQVVDTGPPRAALLACRATTFMDLSEVIRKTYQDTVDTYGLSGKVAYLITDNIYRPGGGLSGFQSDEEDGEQSPIHLEDILGDLTFYPPIIRSFSGALHSCVTEALSETGHFAGIIHKASTLIPAMKVERHRWDYQLKILKTALAEDPLGSELSQYERSVLTELVDVLEPFQEALQSVTNAPHAVGVGNVIPAVRGLKHYLGCVNTRHLRRMAEELQSGVQIRLQEFEENELFILGAMCDPRFRLQWAMESEWPEKKQLFLDRVQQTVDAACDGTADREAEMPKLFQFMRQHPAGRSARNELDLYLSEDCLPYTGNPLDFWRERESQYPTLQRLALSVLSAQMSPDMADRAVELWTREMARHDPGLLQDMIFIKTNLGFLAL